MTVEWWEMAALAISCTLAGWWGARRYGGQVERLHPVPLSEFMPRDVVTGSKFKCDRCHGEGFVRVDRMATLTLECSHCHYSKQSEVASAGGGP